MTTETAVRPRISEPIRKAGRILQDGGVVAYPTEGVFGLGCVPDSLEGAARILTMKRRDPAMGMLLIASDPDQLAPWTDLADDAGRLVSVPERPITWIVPASPDVPYWVRGDHDGVAVRVTTHEVAAALCDAADSALISTSANVSGRPPARTEHVLRREFGGLVDYVVPGRCGPASGPSEIRVFETGEVIRAAQS